VLISLSLTGQISRYFLGHGSLMGLVDFFNLDMENNLPTYFQTAILFFSALLVLFIAKSNNEKRGIPGHYWMTLFIMVIFMGIDETIQIHEKLDIVIHKFLGYETHGIFNFPWVIAGIIISLAFMVYFSFFIRKIDKRTRNMFILSAFLYLFGAIFMEMMGGFFADKAGMANFSYQLLSTVEESAEMFGAAVFIKTLMDYIKMEMHDESFNIAIK
jgi:hypothetical protein